MGGNHPPLYKVPCLESTRYPVKEGLSRCRKVGKIVCESILQVAQIDSLLSDVVVDRQFQAVLRSSTLQSSSISNVFGALRKNPVDGGN